jgi:hypothetical protein
VIIDDRFNYDEEVVARHEDGVIKEDVLDLSIQVFLRLNEHFILVLTG